MLGADKQAWALLEPTLWLVGTLLAAALILVIYQRWTAKAEACAPTASDELSRYRDLYEQGELSKEEYQRLHTMLGGRIKQEQTSPEPKPPAPGENNSPKGVVEPTKDSPELRDTNS